MSAGASVRAGLTLAPVNGIRATWMETSVSGMATGALRRLQDDRDEDRGEDDLEQERVPVAHVRHRRGPGDGGLVEGHQHQRRRRDRPDELRRPVAGEIEWREP